MWFPVVESAVGDWQGQYTNQQLQVCLAHFLQSLMQLHNLLYRWLTAVPLQILLNGLLQ